MKNVLMNGLKRIKIVQLVDLDLIDFIILNYYCY